jgi:hypothetical protein
MITVYLAGIPTYVESDDIEIRYRIYDNEELVSKNSIYREYKKPVVVNLLALIAILKQIERYRGTDITIVVNDPEMNSQIKGTTNTNNKDILKVAAMASEKLRKFGVPVVIKDVSKNTTELAKWNEILKS